MRKKIIAVGVRQPKRKNGSWLINISGNGDDIYEAIGDSIKIIAREHDVTISYVVESPWGVRPRTIGEPPVSSPFNEVPEFGDQEVK
jgi:hypothetical protein